MVNGVSDTDKLVEELIGMSIENCAVTMVDIKIASSGRETSHIHV